MSVLEPAPVCRVRDAARTRAAILQAALQLFALEGYAATGVRDVAARAGVNWALVRRYFGSKEGLLRAALEELLQVEALIVGERSAFGARVVRLFFETESMPSPVAMMMMASAWHDQLDHDENRFLWGCAALHAFDRAMAEDSVHAARLRHAIPYEKFLAGWHPA